MDIDLKKEYRLLKETKAFKHLENWMLGQIVVCNEALDSCGLDSISGMRARKFAMIEILKKINNNCDYTPDEMTVMIESFEEDDKYEEDEE